MTERVFQQLCREPCLIFGPFFHSECELPNGHKGRHRTSATVYGRDGRMKADYRIEWIDG